MSSHLAKEHPLTAQGHAGTQYQLTSLPLESKWVQRQELQPWAGPSTLPAFQLTSPAVTPWFQQGILPLTSSMSWFHSSQPSQSSQLSQLSQLTPKRSKQVYKALDNVADTSSPSKTSRLAPPSQAHLSQPRSASGSQLLNPGLVDKPLQFTPIYIAADTPAFADFLVLPAAAAAHHYQLRGGHDPTRPQLSRPYHGPAAAPPRVRSHPYLMAQAQADPPRRPMSIGWPVFLARYRQLRRDGRVDGMGRVLDESIPASSDDDDDHYSPSPSDRSPSR